MAGGDSCQLTVEQAEALLARVGEVDVAGITRAATTNDVFKAATRSHGNYYVKFHTARWYADQPDTAFVAEREAAVPALLEKRGMKLPYEAWADTTRSTVSRSVFICGELRGVPVPDAVAERPCEAPAIVAALGRYLARLHTISFENAGILTPGHAALAPPSGPVPRVLSWDQHEMHHPEHLQRAALAALEARKDLLEPEAARSLAELFERIADACRPDYAPPRFTVGNCHAWHFHVECIAGDWAVTGFYDFEAASAGDPTIDLVEIEATLSQTMGVSPCRDALFAGYGRCPSFEAYKMRVLYYLLYEVGREWSRMVPDQAWLKGRIASLTQARDWPDLDWYPPR